MTLMRGAALVVLTPEEVRQRSDTSHAAFELRSQTRPCLSSPELSGKAWPFFSTLQDTATVLSAILYQRRTRSNATAAIDAKPFVLCHAAATHTEKKQ